MTELENAGALDDCANMAQCVSPAQADLSWGAAVMPGESWLCRGVCGGSLWGILALPVTVTSVLQEPLLSSPHPPPRPRCPVLSLLLLGCISPRAVVLPVQALTLPTKCGSGSCQSTRQAYPPGWFSLPHEFLCG